VDNSRILDTPSVIARIRAIRLARGWSVQTVADRISEQGGSLSRVAISKIENGDRGLSLDDARLLCDAVDVDLRVVLTDEPLPIKAAVVYV
jgi:transcriptional regulator with XRE-family HTH domain